MPKHLDTGSHAVEAPCPVCGVIELIYADLSTVLTTPTDEPAMLRLRLKAKPVTHLCGQEAISDLFKDVSVTIAASEGEQ